MECNEDTITKAAVKDMTAHICDNFHSLKIEADILLTKIIKQTKIGKPSFIYVIVFLLISHLMGSGDIIWIVYC